MDRQTQNAKVLAYLKENKTATVRELVLNCNINSPRKRLSELAQAGYPIQSIWTERKDEYGDTIRFKVYSLAG